jgi:hypothetical protein
VPHTACITAAAAAAAGDLYVNGVQSTEANHRQAYVEQSDNFYSMLSVAETLTMAAQLQMPPGLPESSKASYVDNLIAVLGLAKVCDGAAVLLLVFCKAVLWLDVRFGIKVCPPVCCFRAKPRAKPRLS